MATSRLTFRQEIGRAIGRRYYQASTLTGTSTVNELVDSKRTESRSEWDGASVYVSSATSPNETIVRGSSDGRIFLDTDLGSVPAISSAYELLKGWTFGDMNEAINFSHRGAYPALYDPLDDDTTVTETVGIVKYTLDLTWRRIASVRRKINGSNPVRYETLVPGYHYDLRRSGTGWVYEPLYDPDITGLNLHFNGEKIPTIGSTDASTSEMPIEVVLPSALYWLYTKGANPDEAAMSARFDQEAQMQAQMAQVAKDRYRMPRQRTVARVGVIGVTNTGATARDGF